MKTILLILLALANVAWGAPFLVCDAVPAQAQTNLNVVQYVITGLSTTPITTQAMINADGSQQLHYDLSAVANGSYTVTAAAVNGLGLEGPFSDPFIFTVGLPTKPTGLRISPT
jgi:hypothetical protein